MRGTILVNLLDAASKNIKYGKKSIALFELGSVFNRKREESQKIAFLYSGFDERASVVNGAKAKTVDFNSFVEKLGFAIGEFILENSDVLNGLMHPYASAKVIKGNKVIGFLSKLHPEVAADFNLNDTYIAELDLEPILPKHILANDLSNFQAVNKDLSVLIDKDLSFYEVAKVLKELQKNEELLKDFYPLDIYSDDSLGDKKSLTIRFGIQSNVATLSDEEIESVMAKALETLKASTGAELR